MTNNPDNLTDQDKQILKEIYLKESKHRPHWPNNFDQTMRDPLISRILILLANHPKEKQAPAKHRHSRPRELEAVDEPAPVIDYRKAHHNHGAGRRSSGFSGAVDLKRMASGDRDD